MSNITYSEYLKYIELEFSKIDISILSEEEKEYYDVVKKDFENSRNMSSHILNAPLISENKILDNETIKNLEFIKENNLQTKSNKFKDFIMNNLTIKSKNYKFVAVAVSFFIFYFLTIAFPIKISINVPNFTWITIQSTPIVIEPTTTSSPLTGTGGQGQGDKSTERYVLEVMWEKSTISITYIIWGVILLSIIIFIFNSSTKNRVSS